ncbi:MAG: hypothetical protein IAE77_23430 [Prosthecobacter sp.]|uniref:hypothetical protein n=1 Tax=Prosthecobacter sp. TaxID=1965333 RepID=UPI0019FB3411|nr:hypothetical protein [Prosthecobacter sp.]MBE2286428.1 hypothetical protein [Prosthecobacter sp.]
MKYTVSRFHLCLLACLLLAVVGNAKAQMLPQVQNRAVDAMRNQIRQADQSASGVSPDDNHGGRNAPAPKMQGDDEFGEQIILARKAHVEPWTLGADVQFFHTNNVALTPDNTLSDTYWRTGFYAQYANRIVGDWFMDASVSSHWFLHGKYDFFDFHLLRTELGVTRRLPWLNDTYAGLHYYWFHIADTEFQRSVFQNHMVNLNLQKTWKVSRGQQFILGMSADLSLAAQPTGPGRHEFTAYAGHTLRLTENWTVQTGLRGGYFYYPEVKRADWNLGLTAGVSYALTDWARLTLSIAGTMNRSNQPAFDYNNFATGAGMSFHVSF